MIAIVSAGGKSRRLNEISCKYTSKIFLPLNGKPLIEYSLKILKEMGAQTVYITICDKKVKNVFTKLLNTGCLTENDYSFLHNEYEGDPYCGLLNKELLRRSYKEKVVWTDGDLFYDKSVINNLLTTIKSGYSFCGIKDNLKKQHKFGFLLNSGGFCNGVYDNNGTVNSLKNITTPIIFNTSVFDIFLQSLINHPNDYKKAYSKTLEIGPSKALNEKIYNINTPEDYKNLIEANI